MVMVNSEREQSRKCILEGLKNIVFKLAGPCCSSYELLPPRPILCSNNESTSSRGILKESPSSENLQYENECVECCQGFLFSISSKSAPNEEVTYFLPVDDKMLQDFFPNVEGKDCLPEIMVAYRLSKNIPLNRSKSRELRGSILYLGCECEKRNGLQDNCPRSECQGNPTCLLPEPGCGPSAYASGKHLGKLKVDLLKYQVFPACFSSYSCS